MNGLIAKTYEKSFFVCFPLDSKAGRKLFSINSFIRDDNRKKNEYSTKHDRPTVIIQCMPVSEDGKSQKMAEVMWKEDFENLRINCESEGMKERKIGMANDSVGMQRETDAGIMGRLQPCPFCGGTAKTIQEDKDGFRAIWCECLKCHAKTKGYRLDTHDEGLSVDDARRFLNLAVMEWNMRF